MYSETPVMVMRLVVDEIMQRAHQMVKTQR